jgi:opacity protein-like surface antigen
MMRLQSVVAALALTAAVGSASAADMSVKAPALPAPVATWTGIYGGVHGGYLWGHTKAEENGVVTEPDAATNGAIGGVLAGYNWQTGLFVLGVEADIGATDAHGTGFRSSTTEPNQYDFNWVGHVRGRIGYDYNQWLLFVAGGLAVADFTFRPGEVTIECIAMGGRFTGFSVGGGRRARHCPRTDRARRIHLRRFRQQDLQHDDRHLQSEPDRAHRARRDHPEDSLRSPPTRRRRSPVRPQMPPVGIVELPADEAAPLLGR